MPQDVNLSTGKTIKNCVLAVRNVTGIGEERGFRLYWVQPEEDRYLMPALGLATSNPFRTATEAAVYGVRVFREKKIFLVTDDGLRRFNMHNR